MAKVTLHIYDVTNGSERTNSAVVRINKIFKDGIGLGGIFHSAVQVYGDDEWSYGFCDEDTGVFSCPSRKNTMFTYRNSLVLGKTNLDVSKVKQILRELSREWPGISYDPFSKNCNHFCEEFCVRLGVPKPPGWVNRFAKAADVAMDMADNTALRFRQAKTEIRSASKAAYRFLLGGDRDNVKSGSDSLRTSKTGGKCAWFKNLVTNGIKSSTASSETMNRGEVEPQLQRLNNTI